MSVSPVSIRFATASLDQSVVAPIVDAGDEELMSDARCCGINIFSPQQINPTIVTAD